MEVTVFSETEKAVLALTRAALRGESFSLPEGADWNSVYQKAKDHCILAMTADCVAGCRDMPGEIYKSWQNERYLAIKKFHLFGEIQEEIGELLGKEGIPFVVLKGFAAAMNYDDPEVRALGDIDFMPARGTFDRAMGVLAANGFDVEQNGDNTRHVHLNKYDVSMEIHRHFSGDKDTEQGRVLDARLFSKVEKIGKTDIGGYQIPVFPETENGLVLLEHLSQHFLSGVGLRQVSDWLCFAEKNLTDQVWKESFQQAAEEVGLAKFARCVTKIGQDYLGFPMEKRVFCEGIDESLCKEVLQSILRDGNFGNEQNFSQRGKGLMRQSNIFAALRYLQKTGVKKWSIFQKYLMLRPFAWIARSFDCLFTLMKIKNPAKEMQKERKISWEKAQMVNKLGIKTDS